MAEEFEKYAVLKNMFRRKSSTEFTGTGFNEQINANQVGGLLDEMGAHVSQAELKKTLDQVDPGHKGNLTFDQYSKLCETFVKDPTATPSAMKFHSMSDFET